jgi:hypothetical protein
LLIELFSSWLLNVKCWMITLWSTLETCLQIFLRQTNVQANLHMLNQIMTNLVNHMKQIYTLYNLTINRAFWMQQSFETLSALIFKCSAFRSIGRCNYQHSNAASSFSLSYLSTKKVLWYGIQKKNYTKYWYQFNLIWVFHRHGLFEKIWITWNYDRILHKLYIWKLKWVMVKL